MIQTAPNNMTTGIGSLPHPNIDSALGYSFRMGIPFLPQIPIRNPWEYMLPNALEGLPGLRAEQDGICHLDLDIWNSRAAQFNQKLLSAFDHAPSASDAFEHFEPTAAASSAWLPFVWELTEQKSKLAKIQIAGPLTSQWSLKLSKGRIEEFGGLSTQIYRLILARALAMARRLLQNDIRPILFIDEPGLYALSTDNPLHRIALQELRIMVKALKDETVLVGLHCCGNTNWKSILEMGLDYISLDAHLSLEPLLSVGAPFIESYLNAGGKFALGVIPTSTPLVSDIRIAFEQLMASFGRHLGSRPDLVKTILSQALFTPACGLAFHQTSDAEFVLLSLSEFHDFCRRHLFSNPSA